MSIVKSALLAIAAASSVLALPSQAAVLMFTTSLSGPNEFPAVDSPGVGEADVYWDTVANSMRLVVEFSGLRGVTTVSHIHCCVDPDAAMPTVGVATQTPTFSGFPSGVSSGIYDHTFDMTLASSYRAAFITANGGTVDGARMALLQGLRDGQAYLNIHTDFATTGEIRGFLQVPEPASYALALVALAGLAGASRRGSSVKGR